MPTDDRLIVARYISGTSVETIAQECDVSVPTIYNVLRRNKIGRRVDETAKKIERLIAACRAGMSIAEAARRLELSDSTATRAIRKHRAAGGDLVVRRDTVYTGNVFGQKVSDEQSLTEADAVVGVAFPYPPQLSTTDSLDQLRKLRLIIGHLDDNKNIRPQSRLGVAVCNGLFPNRFDAHWNNKQSATEAWSNPNKLRRAIAFQIKVGDPTTPRRVLRALTLQCRTPTIFRPAVAKFVYDRYCPPGGVVWDPCSGYGGRLFGAASANVRYIGTDIEPQTVEGNRRLAKIIDANAEIHLESATTFKPPPVDLVFTSPPYFTRERYSTSRNAEWKQLAVDEWFREFVHPVFQTARNALSKSGYLVINIADLKERGTVVPLVSKTVECASSTGFSLVDMLQMPLAAINREKPFEPVLVFRKM